MTRATPEAPVAALRPCPDGGHSMHTLIGDEGADLWGRLPEIRLGELTRVRFRATGT